MTTAAEIASAAMVILALCFGLTRCNEADMHQRWFERCMKERGAVGECRP